MTKEQFLQDAFLFEETEIMNEYDEKNFINNLNFYKEGVEKVLSVVISKDGENKIDMISTTMDHMKDLCGDYKELVVFFEGIHDSPKLDDLPLATKIFNMSAIEKIRPQYLKQMTTNIGLTIDKYLKGKISKKEIENLLLSDTYLLNYKKQLVRTSIPYNLDPKEMNRYDCGVIVDVNGELIDNTILPFLRNIPQFVKDIEVTAANTMSAIRSGYDDVEVYATVVDNLMKDGKIGLDDYRFLNKYLYKAVRNFMTAASYLTFIMIRKISLISGNMTAYKELQIKILNYFPEGDRVLHEHVMDGSFDDIDGDALVHSILLNDNSLFRSVIHTIVNRERSDLSYVFGNCSNDDDHSMIDLELQNHPYKDVCYKNAVGIFNQISESLDCIRANAKDGQIPFDDIIDKCGLKDPLTSRFTSVIHDISNVKDYEYLIGQNLSMEDQKRLYFMALNELSDADKLTDEITEAIYETYNKYMELEEDLSQGDTLVFKNTETVKELLTFLDDFDAEYRQLVLAVSQGCISRFKELIYTINSIEKVLFVNPDVNNLQLEYADEAFDFGSYAIESDMEIDAAINQAVFESYMREYYKERIFYETGMKVVFEAGLATSASATNDGSNNNQNQNNTNNSNSQKSFKDQMQEIINAIRNFFTKSRNMLEGIIDKQKGNLQWLTANREALINRNFTGMTFNVLPYEKYVSTDQILTDIQSLQTNVSNLNSGNIKKYNSQRNLNSYLFKFMENNAGSTEDISEVANKYYKVKNAPLEVMPYKGGQAKALMPIMVDYCIAFYSNFSNDLLKRLDDLSKTTTDVLNKLDLMKESVMFEADGDNNQQNNQTNTNQNNQNQKNNTKPSVQKDTTGSSVRGNDGKKVETDSTYTIVKWLNRSVQAYSSAVLNAARDRNYDYLKIIQAAAPRELKQNNNQNNNQ